MVQITDLKWLSPLYQASQLVTVLTTGQTVEENVSEAAKDAIGAVGDSVKRAVPAIAVGSILLYGGYRLINDMAEKDTSLITVQVVQEAN